MDLFYTLGQTLRPQQVTDNTLTSSGVEDVSRAAAGTAYCASRSKVPHSAELASRDNSHDILHAARFQSGVIKTSPESSGTAAGARWTKTAAGAQLWRQLASGPGPSAQPPVSSPASAPPLLSHAAGNRDSSMENTPLWVRMVGELQVPADVASGALAALQQRFGVGVAWDLMRQPWLVQLSSLKLFADDVRKRLHGVDLSSPDGCIQHVTQELYGFVFQMISVVVNHELSPLNLDVSDDAKLLELRGRGFQHKQGWTWLENNCLPDSLLQLLVLCGLVHNGLRSDGVITAEDRKEACQDVRSHFGTVMALMPRSSVDGQEDPTAYMEHYRHADAIVKHFLARFPSERQLPAAGLMLHVHARYDTAASPADLMSISRCVGSAPGLPLHLHLYCSTGAGISGYHYDPLVAQTVVVDLEALAGGAPETSQHAASASTAAASSSGQKHRDAAVWPAVVHVQEQDRSTRSLGAAGGVAGTDDRVGQEQFAVPSRLSGDQAAASPTAHTDGQGDFLQSWEQELRRRVSPQSVDSNKCMARTHRGGQGGQCSNLPTVGRLCKRCAKGGSKPAHGFVDGRVPAAKWKAFGICEQEVSRLKATSGDSSADSCASAVQRDSPPTTMALVRAEASAQSSAPAAPTRPQVPALVKRRATSSSTAAQSSASGLGASLLKRSRHDGQGRCVDQVAPSMAEQYARVAESRAELSADLADEDLRLVTQQFLTQRSASGQAVTVSDIDIARLRAALCSDDELTLVLQLLVGASSIGAEVGRDRWRSTVDQFVGLLHLRHTALQGPRRLGR